MYYILYYISGMENNTKTENMTQLNEQEIKEEREEFNRTGKLPQRLLDLCNEYEESKSKQVSGMSYTVKTTTCEEIFGWD